MKYIKYFEKNSVEEKKELTNILSDTTDSLLEPIFKIVSNSPQKNKKIEFVSNSHTNNMNFITIHIFQDDDGFGNINKVQLYDKNRNNEITEFFRLLIEKFASKYKINIGTSKLTYYIRYTKVPLLIEFLKKYKKSKSFKKYLTDLEMRTNANKYNL